MTQPEFEEFSRQQINPLERKNELMPPQQQQPPQHLMNNAMPGHMPFMPFNAAVPPFSMAPPQFGVPPQQWANLQNFIDPKILAGAAQWTEHRAPDGRFYYYNAATQQSIWEKPQALKDLDEARMSAMRMQQQKVELKQPNEADLERERKKKEEQEKAKPQKPLDKSRPISSTPIAGTPWCVVWTGDSKVFFYCPSTKTSVWERPDELKGRPDVDKAVNTVPDQLKSDVNHAEIEAEREKKEKQAKKMPVKEPQVQLQPPQPAPTQDDDEQMDIEKSDESNEDDDVQEVPIKKQKIEESQPPAKTANEKKLDGIAEAERKAADERAKVPLETRVNQFKEMLKEKEVSAFSTWEKELHKIVFDPRYLLLASKERKQVFEKYVKDRAEDERREKRQRLQQKRDEFKELLRESNLHAKSSFSDFCSSRHSRDDRFRAIEKMRDREDLFNDYVDDLRRKESEHKREQIKKKYFDLLRETSSISHSSTWSEIKRRIDHDSRYKAVSHESQLEDWFYEHVKVLKEERKKRKAEKKEKKKKSKEKLREETENEKNSPSVDESKDKSDEIKPDNDEPFELSDAESSNDSEKAEEGEHSGTDSETERQRKDKERIARAEASIKKRNQEVKETLMKTKDEREKERLHHRRDEAVRQFAALLTDLVRKSDLTWKEAKKLLKKDGRWEIVENLDRETRDRLFADHISSLNKKKRDNFREMLDEIPEIGQETSWSDVKKKVRDDPRYYKFYDSEKVRFDLVTIM